MKLNCCILSLLQIIAYIFQSYQFSISETSSYPAEVGSVVAEDKDSGSYGDVQYTLEGVNSDHFIIVTKADQRMVICMYSL